MSHFRQVPVVRLHLLVVQLWLIACPIFVLASDPIRLPVTQDNSIVLVDGEWNVNAGQQSRLRIKGNQHIVAMAFDMTAVKGKRIKRATLVCKQSEQAISGVTLSTITSPWLENESTGLTAGIPNVVDWGYPGARFPAVSGGNSFTLVHNTESKLSDGVYQWEVPPDFVHAMAIGIAYGIAIHEHDVDYTRNPTIFSKEQSAQVPYLLVEIDDGTEAAPQPVSALTVTGIEDGLASLNFKSPSNGFAYEIFVDGESLGRHNIPLVVPNTRQTIRLRDFSNAIKADVPSKIEVFTLNRTSDRSQGSSIESSLFKVLPISRVQVSLETRVKSPIRDLAFIPVSDKFDADGKPVGELPEGYRTQNAIYNGERIRLVAAAGEVIGFQMLLRGQGEVSIKVVLKELKPRIDSFQAVYVPVDGRWIPDPLIPMPEKVLLTTEKDVSVFTDIYIPYDAQPKLHIGSVSISDGRVVPIEVQVLPFAIPKQASFFCEMNSYGLPDYVDDYIELQRIAYDHRVHANVLHYSHNTAAPGSRKSNLDMRLQSGRRMDNKRYNNIEPGQVTAYWNDFVEAFGSYIDGSMFQDGHRGAVPAPGFYLTFHESWPLNCRQYFNGNPDAYKAFIDEPVYAETYVNILRDFASLAESKGWNKTGFQVYFNNKGSLNESTKAPWILDEPTSFWDYRALKFYGELTDQGLSKSTDVQIDFRVDLSRPEFCRGQLGNSSDLWIVSSTAFQNYRRLVTDRMHCDGLKVWIYGTSNHVDDSNRNIQAWALEAWRNGATGIVPWQTVDKSGKALKEADQLGIFIFETQADGTIEIRHSARLKAYREAQQLIEYLNVLKDNRGWTQEQMSRFVAQYVELNSEVIQTNDADAGTSAFARLSPIGLDTLKLAVVELLSKDDRVAD